MTYDFPKNLQLILKKMFFFFFFNKITIYWKTLVFTLLAIFLRTLWSFLKDTALHHTAYIYIHVYTLFYCWQEKAISIFSMTANVAPFPTLFSSYKKLMFVPHQVPDIELSFPFYFFKANVFFWRTPIHLNIIFAVYPGFHFCITGPFYSDFLKASGFLKTWPTGSFAADTFYWLRWLIIPGQICNNNNKNVVA